MRYVWLLLILIIVVSGCELTQTSQPKNVAPETPSNQASRLTNRGIELDFLQGKPPQDRIILGRPFGVRVLLKNWATEPISGQVSVSDTQKGHDIECINGIEKRSFTISGVDERIKQLKPKEKEIDFGNAFVCNNNLLPGITIRAQLEYDYKVKFTIPICVKTENAIVSEAECTSRMNFGASDFGFSAQHAPVTITNIRQETDAAGDSAYIVLYLLFEDFGGGKDGVNNPDRSIDISNSIKLAGQGTFKCNPGVLSFKDKKREEVSCELSTTFNLEDVERENFFQNPLDIEFSYPYKTIFATAKIPIKKPLEERTFFAEQDSLSQSDYEGWVG